MKKQLSVLVAATMSVAVSAGNVTSVIYVVDISGSMAPALGNVSRAIIESVDTEAMKKLKKSLVLFEGCGIDTAKVAVPLASNNSDAIKNVAKTLRPGGATDIVAGLMRAKDIVDKNLQQNGDCANIVLFTDDEDTCGNGKKHFDLLKQMKTTCAEKNAVFSLDVITTTKDEDVRLFLDKLAEVGDGKVHTALTLDELNEVLERIVEQRRKKNTGVPLTSTQDKPETGTGNTQPKPVVKPKPAEKPAPAQQGGSKPTHEEKRP